MYVADIEFEEPKSDTIYMLCYTSGTTGDPKGSMIPHSYFVSCCNFVKYFPD